MAAENQNFGQPTTGAQSAGGQQPPPVPVAMPYVPTPEEEQYLAECAAAITAGCQSAVTAAAAPNGGAEYLQFANGVKALTDAYEAIKTGGKPSRHQGA